MLKRFWAGLEFPHFFRSQNQQSVILAASRSAKAFDRLIFRRPCLPETGRCSASLERHLSPMIRSHRTRRLSSSAQLRTTFNSVAPSSCESLLIMANRWPSEVTSYF